jgi:hypothetical protein
MGWFSRSKIVSVSAGGILTLELPNTFVSEGSIRENTERSIYRFIQHKENDWGGYPHYPVLLYVTVFNPAFPRAEHRQILAESFALLATDLSIDDPSKLAWTNGPSSRLASVKYKKNLTEKEAWVVTAATETFAVDFYAWKSKYSAAHAKALVNRVVDSIKLSSLEQHWRDIEDQPRRAKEAREKKLAQIEGMLAAAGWPAASPPGQIIKHDGFLYATSADRAVFGIALKLGELKTTRPDGDTVRVEAVLAPEDQKQLPSVWYFPEHGDWQILDRESPWKPGDELLAHLRAGFHDPQHTLYFFAMRGFYFEYTEVGDFQLKDFAEQAKQLENLFQQGKLVRLR